jgi:hypothetical protein
LLLAGAVGALVASGVVAQAATADVAPSVAPELAVPAGNELFQSVHATGVQIYRCNSTGTAWTFVAPQATLFDDGGELFGTHFAGPTWQATDGSTVKGAKIASHAVAGAIPELLLQAVSTTIGPNGNTLTPTTYIQRLHTTDGLAPSGGCAAGSGFDSPYTADYYFYASTNAQQ